MSCFNFVRLSTAQQDTLRDYCDTLSAQDRQDVSAWQPAGITLQARRDVSNQSLAVNSRGYLGALVVSFCTVVGIPVGLLLLAIRDAVNSYHLAQRRLYYREMQRLVEERNVRLGDADMAAAARDPNAPQPVFYTQLAQIVYEQCRANPHLLTNEAIAANPREDFLLLDCGAVGVLNELINAAHEMGDDYYREVVSDPSFMQFAARVAMDARQMLNLLPPPASAPIAPASVATSSITTNSNTSSSASIAAPARATVYTYQNCALSALEAAQRVARNFGATLDDTDQAPPFAGNLYDSVPPAYTFIPTYGQLHPQDGRPKPPAYTPPTEEPPAYRSIETPLAPPGEAL